MPSRVYGSALERGLINGLRDVARASTVLNRSENGNARSGSDSWRVAALPRAYLDEILQKRTPSLLTIWRWSFSMKHMRTGSVYAAGYLNRTATRT